MMGITTFLLLLLFFAIVHSDTNFVHFFGAAIYADTLSTYSTSNATDCVEECAVTTSCSAVQMVWGSGTCNLLTMIRAAVADNNNCAYYIRQYDDVDISGRTLSDMDQLIQNAVYASQEDCPDGWTAGATTCTLSISESTCDEYASFLEATFDGTNCVIPLMNVTYSCPNDSYTLGSYADGHYCHSMIDKWTDNPDNKTYQVRSDEYCYEQTGGRLASIHSAEENTVVNAIQNTSTQTIKGLQIALVSKNVGITSSDDMVWLDGTSVTYTNYLDGDYPRNTTWFYYTLMTVGGLWNTAPAYGTLRIIACKQNAKATYTKIT